MLEVKGLCKSFGALRASDGIDFHVAEGETHALIGPNGAGKTTFISQLAGNLRPDAGRIRFAGEDITALSAPKRSRKGLARSFQITSVYPGFTALENVALAVQARSGHSFRFWRDARGDPALTAVLTILTGITGAIIVTPLMNALRLRNYAARGFAAGLTSHGIGTARAFQVNPLAGTFAGIALGLNGLLTALLVPLLLPWLLN